jgi:hypothetical protein
MNAVKRKTWQTQRFFDNLQTLIPRRKSMKRAAYLIALFVAVSAHLAMAQIPQCLSYQGTLRTGGVLVTGNHNLTLRIYSVATGGTAIWTETISNVAFSRGIFTVLLGDPSRTPPVPLNLAFDRTYWLGISIDGGTELTPRVILCASPYSLNAKAVLGNTSTSNVFPASGKVGIGTLNPTGKLQVEDAEWNSAPLLVRGQAGGVVGPAITMDATDGTGGRKYSIISTNSGAAAAAGKLAIWDDSGGAYRFVLDAGGDIGIGTTNPTSKLQVSSSTSGGLADPTLRVDNLSTAGGVAGWFSAKGTDATVALHNLGSGPLLKGFGGNGGEAEFLFDNDGSLKFYDASFNNTIKLSPTTGRTTTKVLEITGGSDLSEQFEVNHPNEVSGEIVPESLQPGMVVSIDAQNPGKLVVSNQAYDHKVAGIISGAGGIATGMLMGQQGSPADGSTPVALAGRVYCWADATHGAIEPGDMLTTSDTPGHAMKVTDHAQAQGATIGKSMTGLAHGKGLVLVLVTLQ